MTDNRWDNLGVQLRDSVDDAIRRGDFSNLSRMVGNAIYDTIDWVSGGYRQDGYHPGYGQGSYYNGTYSQTNANEPQINPNVVRQGRYVNGSGANGSYAGQRGGYQQNSTVGNQGNGQRTSAQGAASAKRETPRYQMNPSGRLIALGMCVIGFFFGFFSALATIGCAMTAWMFRFEPDEFGLVFGTVVFGIITLGLLVMAIKGTKKLFLLNRYRQYIRVIQSRLTVPVRELASQVGKTPEFTARDLQSLIEKRFFFEAHLDDQCRDLILTNAAYQDYVRAKLDYVTRQGGAAATQQAKPAASASAKTSQKKPEDNLPPECRELIQKGEAYIKSIHDSNARIPGEEITRKLAQMEKVVSRIFGVVREHPEVASELDKLMSYYLPTTQKLLDAYEELDRQPVQGEHISTTKKQIEETIDTLNEAFAKLLDSLFENRAWDISSDIFALHTILAQDGLKEDQLQQAQKEKIFS